MGLNLQSLSITSAFNSIVQYFKSQENTTRIKELSNGSEASFFIRLLSNVFSAISYRVVAQSRENYLSTAALISSNIGLAVNLGYSAFRGSNLKRLIELTPNGNYTLPKLSVIGTYSNDYDIITLEDVTLVKDKPAEIKTVVGKIKEETITAGTSAIKIFSLFTTGISEDYVLYLDSTEVPTANVIKRMKDDKYLVRTNPYSSVDIAYLNTFPSFKYKYGTGSEITIRYVELANMTEVPYTADMFSYGTLTDVTTISSYQPFVTVDELKVTAPLDHELQNLIRSKEDYAGRLLEIIPSVIDTDFTALTPTYTLISYLKNDGTLLSGTYVPEDDYEDGVKPVIGEIGQVQELLKEENFFGTPLPDITVPRREVAHLQIDVELSNKYKNISDVNLDIANIIDNSYNKVLGATFNIYDLERKIENLSYIKYARVNHITNERSANTNYQLGYILDHNNQYYMASKILGVSGTSRPDWNLPIASTKQIDTSRETVDGSVVWRTFKRLPNMDSTDLTLWQGNALYGIGDYVYDSTFPDYMFKCVDLLKSSGETTPEVGEVVEKGDFVIDGSLVWVVKDFSNSYEIWQPTTTYRLGRSVNLSTAAGVYSMECISYRGTAGTEETLEFESPVYDVFNQTSNTFVVVGNKRYYFRAGDIITASYSGGYTSFTVASSTYLNGYTTITVEQTIDTDKTYINLITKERGTRDGQILWKLLDDIENITYGWNSYVTFDHVLNVLN